MKTPLVFIPQEPARLENNVWVPTMNLQAAEAYGQCVTLCSPGRVLLSTAPTIQAMRAKMAGFDDNDFIVAIGDPGLIGIACCTAMLENQGRYKLLKWDGGNKRYTVVEVDMYHNQRPEDKEAANGN